MLLIFTQYLQHISPLIGVVKLTPLLESFFRLGELLKTNIGVLYCRRKYVCLSRLVVWVCIEWRMSTKLSFVKLARIWFPKTIKAKYFPHRSFKRCKKKSLSSWHWKVGGSVVYKSCSMNLLLLTSRRFSRLICALRTK